MKQQISSEPTITLKGIIDEDFVNYKVPSMTLMFPYCNFKCGSDYCQNSELAKADSITISIDGLCARYLKNNITRSIVCQGLEPFDSFEELISLIYKIRVGYKCYDDIVIYTGYEKEEVSTYIEELKKYENIIVKFGRYIPNQVKHKDDILGVYLASDNQYAERIKHI